MHATEPAPKAPKQLFEQTGYRYEAFRPVLLTPDQFEHNQKQIVEDGPGGALFTQITYRNKPLLCKKYLSHRTCSFFSRHMHTNNTASIVMLLVLVIPWPPTRRHPLSVCNVFIKLFVLLTFKSSPDQFDYPYAYMTCLGGHMKPSERAQ